MTFYQYICKTFAHYFGRNLLVASGVAVSVAVLTGALIIGDSVRFSLEQTTHIRLGKISHVITVTDRFFRSGLASEMARETGFAIAPALMLEGIAVADGGQQRLNKVQVIGIDDMFAQVAGMNQPFGITGNEVIISENMAMRLQVQPGDAFLLRVAKASLIPKNAPFVSDTESSIAIRVSVKSIAGKCDMGHFNLKNSQSAPFNLYISIDRLNRLMEFEGRANRLLIQANSAENNELDSFLAKNLTPADAGLSLRLIENTGEFEIASERVFIEPIVAGAFLKVEGTKPVLTYFVNELRSGNSETPYSFVASMPIPEISDNEIIINQWTATDLNLKEGDTIRMTYFEIGPLRQLEENAITLTVKRVVPIEGKWADGTLMPNLPGLSEAGHCREWEAGIPIDLNKIRQKDEDYWNEYKGIPKAFISFETGRKLWANRYGNLTSIRIPATGFSDRDFQQLFSENIQPTDIGFTIQAVKEEGLESARGGVNFSELFLGLSFFLLLSAIILSVLLFRFNLENRDTQTGTLMQLGFSNLQILLTFLAEAFLTALAGVVAGLFLAVGYTRLVFAFLNSLWWDIVRTNVLLIRIEPKTLFIGAIISLVVVLAAIVVPVRRYLKQQVADLQRSGHKIEKPFISALKTAVAIAFPILALIILIWQLLSGEAQNPGFFFVAGGLLLAGLLTWSEKLIQRTDPKYAEPFTINGLISRNLNRNKGRSLAVIILFALGAFLVVSTGANRQDMFSGADKPSAGTGGFHFFAETSVPVLFDLNDPSRRHTEGLPDDFTAVQFHKVDGDDASCLNLNRISNPAILGVDPSMLTGRFSFVTRTPELDEENPWLSLKKTIDNGLIPAIADQTVIQWGLGLKVGDILMYQNETGDTLRLKLIGGLAPSIFQGFVMISNCHFLSHYPTHSGSSVFLVDSNSDNPSETGNSLQKIFRDFGWEMTSAPQRLAEFYSVTNTYLAIFLALGALGLALGTIGLALVLARSVLERKREIAILQAIGFAKPTIIRMLVSEYARLLLTGVGIGSIAAIVATLPAFFSKNTDISITAIILVVTLIVLNGLFWIYFISWRMIKSAVLTEALKNE